MQSKFPGKCKLCGNSWNVGDGIYMTRNSADKAWLKCISEQCHDDQVRLDQQQNHEEATVNVPPQRTLEGDMPTTSTSPKTLPDDIAHLNEKMETLKEMVSEVIRMLADQKLEQMQKQTRRYQEQA